MSSDHDLERKADSPNKKLMVPQFVRIGASLFLIGAYFGKLKKMWMKVVAGRQSCHQVIYKPS